MLLRSKSAAPSKAPSAASPDVSQIAGECPPTAQNRFGAIRAMSKAPKPPIEMPPIATLRGLYVEAPDQLRDQLVEYVGGPLATSAIVPIGALATVGKGDDRGTVAKVGERLEHRLDEIAALILAPPVQEDQQRPILRRRPPGHDDAHRQGLVEQLAVDVELVDLGPEGVAGGVSAEPDPLDGECDRDHHERGTDPQRDRHPGVRRAVDRLLGGRRFVVAHAPTVPSGRVGVERSAAGTLRRGGCRAVQTVESSKFYFLLWLYSKLPHRHRLRGLCREPRDNARADREARAGAAESAPGRWPRSGSSAIMPAVACCPASGSSCCSTATRRFWRLGAICAYGSEYEVGASLVDGIGVSRASSA